MQKNKHAFTLVELLVVVLIIGVLSAIAIPMYQGAVDKSHWSTMLPGAKAIKDAEEAIKMSNGEYTNTMANLDVTMENADLTFSLITPNNTSEPNVIRVTNSKLANVRLASYLDDNPKFAGQLHCEAAIGDERANRLCGKLLMGQELTSQDGYTGYLLDQDIDKATCDNANRSWSTSKTKCYKDTATKCDNLGSAAIVGTDLCGVKNGSGIFGDETVCLADMEWGCQGNGVSFTGGTCVGLVGGLHTCSNTTFTNGSICVSNTRGQWGDGACFQSQFTNGSICYANVSGACGTHWQDGQSGKATSYDETSCCCGAYCGSAPSCESRGKSCDPYYMDKNNFLD
ncbi:MAG: prepilin-type N-terminal cleavage/methylation domain-containing protein [Elusimicrobiaceae bacterium]|nr:prepilin-type N-terminal cleavage/methylation domain-containing protein [Elusimicrobiaceae bacterium]